MRSAITSQSALPARSTARSAAWLCTGEPCIRRPGIQEKIAQTMVHLGVELNVISKATLADAFAVALRQTGRAVIKTRKVETSTSDKKIGGQDK